MGLLRAKNSTLTHSVKVKYVISLKIASDSDVEWLFNATQKEYLKRIKKGLQNE